MDVLLTERSVRRATRHVADLFERARFLPLSAKFGAVAELATAITLNFSDDTTMLQVCNSFDGERIECSRRP